MREFIFTSDRPKRSLRYLLIGFGALLFLSLGEGTQQANAEPPVGSFEPVQGGSENEDYSESPIENYADSSQDEKQEAEDSKFYQYGRFFGVSLGLGYEAVDGNRGQLWQGGFPMVDFKLHYWFDFNIALDLGFYTAYHFYDAPNVNNLGHVDVNMFNVGMDVKYYFDTQNLAAPLSFANPYLALGFGTYTHTDSSVTQGGTPSSTTALGVRGGGGLEFAIKPKSIYFELEGKIHMIFFNDNYSGTFSSMGIPDLTGNFYTVSGNLLFTW